MNDRDIAIRLLALDEVSGSEDPAGVLNHFDQQFDGWSTMKHSGDCNKNPWSCMRCIHAETMARVPGFRKLFSELNKPT